MNHKPHSNTTFDKFTRQYGRDNLSSIALEYNQYTTLPLICYTSSEKQTSQLQSLFLLAMHDVEKI